MLLFASIIFQIKTLHKLKTAGQNTGKTIPMTTEEAIWRSDSSLSFIMLASIFFGFKKYHHQFPLNTYTLSIQPGAVLRQRI